MGKGRGRRECEERAGGCSVWLERSQVTLLGLDLLICTVMLTDLALPSEMLCPQTCQTVAWWWDPSIQRLWKARCLHNLTLSSSLMDPTLRSFLLREWNLWHFSPLPFCPSPCWGARVCLWGWQAGQALGYLVPFHGQSEGTTFQVGAGGSEGQDSEGKTIAIIISYSWN